MITNQEDIAQKGQEIYESRLRSVVETQANIGKVLVLDITTQDYEIAENGLIAGQQLRQRYPNAAMYCLRIGYESVYSFSGELVRTKR